jgi:hypothetical protein
MYYYLILNNWHLFYPSLTITIYNTHGITIMIKSIKISHGQIKLFLIDFSKIWYLIFIWPFLMLLHWKWNTIFHHKGNSPCFIFSLDNLYEWICPWRSCYWKLEVKLIKHHKQISYKCININRKLLLKNRKLTKQGKQLGIH